MTVFTERDRFTHQSNGELNDVVSAADEGGDAEDEDANTSIGYFAPAWVIRDRLEVMGFTLAAAKEVFEQGISMRIAEIRDSNAESDEFENDEISVLETLSFDAWLAEFHEIIARKLYWWNVSASWEAEHVSDVSEALTYMLEHDSDHIFGFPQVDIRYVLRAALEACEPDTPIVQDLTGVISAGYHDREQAIAADARERLLNDFPANAKIIVLTEGVTDRRALEGTLQLIYPHLADYYSFMDFSGAQLAGGAGAVVTTLKAFAGAGIANRIIALLDNDTAARVAMRSLDRMQLPPNMRALHYPPLEYAKEYPTVGPAGEAKMDVNELAGSLELYFGADVLRGPNDEFIPVHWRGFERTVGQYQGELMEKAALQEKFAQKLRATGQDATLLRTLDWSGMSAILDVVRNAFT